MTQTLTQRFSKAYKNAGVPLSQPAFFVILLIVAIAAAILIGTIAGLSPAGVKGSEPIISTIVFVAVLSLFFAIPISMSERRRNSIEEQLPEALRHMSIVLKAGGNVETALAEAARNDYGPLSGELSKALDRIRKGTPFEQAITDIAVENDSALFNRIALILNDAKRSGAGIADAINAIAEDIKEIDRLRRERKTKTETHTIFLTVSALFLAPFIFGFVLNIVSFVGTGISCSLSAERALDLSLMNAILLAFSAWLAIVCSAGVGVIRDGKWTSNLSVAPMMMLISVLMFEFGKVAGYILLGGAVSTC